MSQDVATTTAAVDEGRAPQSLNELTDQMVEQARALDTSTSVSSNETETKPVTEKKEEPIVEKNSATKRKQAELEFRKQQRAQKSQLSTAQSALKEAETAAARLAALNAAVADGDTEKLRELGVDLAALNKRALFRDAEKDPIKAVETKIEKMQRELDEKELRLEEKEANASLSQKEKEFAIAVSEHVLKNERYDYIATLHADEIIDAPATIMSYIAAAGKALDAGEDTGFTDDEGEPRIPNLYEIADILEARLEKQARAYSKSKKMSLTKSQDTKSTPEKRAASVTKTITSSMSSAGATAEKEKKYESLDQLWDDQFAKLRAQGLVS